MAEIVNMRSLLNTLAIFCLTLSGLHAIDQAWWSPLATSPLPSLSAL